MSLSFLRATIRRLERRPQAALKEPGRPTDNPLTEKEMGKLICDHLPQLLNIARTFSPRAGVDPEDLRQDLIVQILRKRNYFVPGTNFLAWCRQILRNDSINKYRDAKRRGYKVALDDAPSSALARPAAAEARIELAEIALRLEKVPAHYRQTFEKMAILGYSQDEVAIEENISPITARGRVARTRSILEGKSAIPRRTQRNGEPAGA